MKIITSTDPVRFLDLDAPTVAAHPCTCPETGRLLWRIDCPICGEAHYHGPGEGHRIGHCQPVTAESIKGYNLALHSAWEKVAASQSKHDARPQPTHVSS